MCCWCGFRASQFQPRRQKLQRVVVALVVVRVVVVVFGVGFAGLEGGLGVFVFEFRPLLRRPEKLLYCVVELLGGFLEALLLVCSDQRVV